MKKTKATTIKLDGQLLDALKKEAKKRNIGYTTLFKKLAKDQLRKMDRNDRSIISYLEDNNKRLEKLVEDKDAQISYFMKFFDNKIELVLSGKSQN